MRLLLDTHVLLWSLFDESLLSPATIRLLKDPDSLVMVSAVSAWEISIKQSIGKLRIPQHWYEVVEEIGYTPLTIRVDHALEVGNLPNLHKDPFDRMLVAQARVEGLKIVTRDERLRRYSVDILAA
ncbi:MAG: type II toxin-antitoxin system VapC family toxin [Candidatus Omnitrophica bacterium]|nr:hypothetical protein [bacterium]NUN95446.1 type II toxin-antitoxin system VapC family toxin [Candidatus Omnitrophota bacterium]